MVEQAEINKIVQSEDVGKRREAMESVYDFEVLLRKFIEKSLSDAYSGDWIKGIPNNPTEDRGGMLDRWKRKKELDFIKGNETSGNLIDQAEFSDYKQIIEDKQNWKKIYRETFHDINKRKVLLYLEELADFRNKVFHIKGPLEIDEFNYSKHQIKWIMKKIQQKYPMLFGKSRQIGDNGADSSFKIAFAAKINECLDLIEVSKYSSNITEKYDELLLMIKKEIDAWNKENFCFAIRESFINFYPYFDKLNFTFEGLKELFVYAHNMRKRFAIDIIGELVGILFDATMKEEENKVMADGCSALLLDISIGFIEKDFDITELYFLTVDDMAEDNMTSRRLLSMMIVMGAKITQSKNKTKRIKNFVDQIIRSLEYDDMEPWDMNYFSYLLDSYKYLYEEIRENKDIEEKYDISLSKFYDKYIIKIIERNKNHFIEEFVSYLEETSLEDEWDKTSGIESTEKWLDGALKGYARLYPNLLEELSYKLREKMLKTRKNEFNRILIELNGFSSGHLRQVISGALNR